MSWKCYEFLCEVCEGVFEDLVKGTEGLPESCELCGAAGPFVRQVSAPAVLTTIVPSYPGAKRVKAGYQHTHNRPAEKKDRQVSMAGTGGVGKRGA